MIPYSPDKPNEEKKSIFRNVFVHSISKITLVGSLLYYFVIVSILRWCLVQHWSWVKYYNLYNLREWKKKKCPVNYFSRHNPLNKLQFYIFFGNWILSIYSSCCFCEIFFFVLFLFASFDLSFFIFVQCEWDIISWNE